MVRYKMFKLFLTRSKIIISYAVKALIVVTIK